MSDSAVVELAKTPSTQGKLDAFRQIIVESEKDLVSISERIKFNDGARNGVVKSVTRIQDYITLMIKQDSKRNIDNEIIKQKRDLLLDVKRNVEEIGKNFLSEELMLKGEARKIHNDMERIKKLMQTAILQEKSLLIAEEELEKKREESRKMREDDIPSENKKVKKFRKVTKLRGVSNRLDKKDE